LKGVSTLLAVSALPLALVGSTLPGHAAAAGRNLNSPSAPAPLSRPDRAGTVKTIALSGRVLYEHRNCYHASSHDSRPLAGAKLVFDGPVEGSRTLDAGGHFKVRLAPGGHLPLHGWVVLNGPAIAVAPHVGAPYRLPLGKVAFRGKDGHPVIEHHFLIAGDGPAGAANIWSVLNLGARVGRAASPVHLPKIWARWRFKSDLKTWIGDSPPNTHTHWDPNDETIYVAGHRHGNRDDWEPFILLHEYGHALLQFVADPSSPGGEHTITGVYKSEPALPYEEGFGDAYAAAVLKTGVLGLGCNRANVINLDSTPATPRPDVERLAQYNEVAIAAVIWKLVNHFGAGDSHAGLRPFLEALHSYKRDGHPPQSTREMRDALIEGGLEKNSPAEHIAIDKIFAAERIAWGLFVEVQFPDYVSGGVRADQVLSGPGAYSSCRLADGDPSYDYGPPDLPFSWTSGLLVQGGLAYTWQSDCLLSGSYVFLDQTNLAAAEMWLRFPYLPGNAHLSPFVYSVDLTCQTTASYTCPASYSVKLLIATGVWGSTPDQAYATDPAQTWVRPEVLPGLIIATVTLPTNVLTQVVSFDGNGNCELSSGADCGV
jgi:hypothetical protein